MRALALAALLLLLVGLLYLAGLVGGILMESEVCRCEDSFSIADAYLVWLWPFLMLTTTARCVPGGST